jgi:L-fuculose-phosphate aldolase
MNDAEYALRKEIVATCLAMDARGINQGTSGNISVRWEKGLLITPSGLAYETMAPEDIIFLGMDGTPRGPHNPSTEWRFHRDIMKARKDVNAIVHAQPIHCTAMAMTRQDIPAVHYMIAAAGGPSVRCAPYATYGTEELSKAALGALKGRLACLLANHGAIACGTNLRKAFWLMSELEVLARQFIMARQAGAPVVLPNDEISRVVEKFKSYGPSFKRGKTS